MAAGLSSRGYGAIVPGATANVPVDSAVDDGRESAMGDGSDI